MGVGYPEDLVICSLLGADLFDCVWPARTARFGQAIGKYGLINIKNSINKNDPGPLDTDCDCVCCKNYSKKYLHMYLEKNEIVGQLITIHNYRWIYRLFENLRKIVEEGNEDKIGQFVKEF
mmetsp:Transcript_70786/g.152477  ORF Transcript_70786/g.152477 Transcript_70786/m.152477 type:complete len:121 (+) Transcript_70786:137-499(+)